MNDASWICLVIEDEPAAAEYLVMTLGARGDCRIAGVVSDLEAAERRLAAGGVNLIFLDMELGADRGYRLKLPSENKPSLVVTTAFREYAYEAFGLRADDFLLKPYTPDDLNRAMDRVGRSRPLTTPNLISLRVENEWVVVNPLEITQLASAGKNTNIFYKDKVIHATGLLRDIAVRLPIGKFLRIHKQFVVRTDCVTGVFNTPGGYVVRLGDGEQSTIPVGRNYLTELRRYFCF